MTTPSPEGSLHRAVAAEACLGAGRGARNPPPDSCEGQRTIIFQNPKELHWNSITSICFVHSDAS